MRVTDAYGQRKIIKFTKSLEILSKGILLAYASDGRVWATEDYQVH
jgi:hypothetical protein